MDFASGSFLHAKLPIIPLLLTASIGMTGCGEEGTDRLPFEPPTQEFSEDYLLSDFAFSGNVDYWEIRFGRSDLSLGYDVVARYDQPAYDLLDTTQIQTLEMNTSQQGMAGGCFPGGCIYYGVAMNGYVATVIDSREDLISLFGEINTEAELFVRLEYAGDYQAITHPETFQEVEDGYLAVLSWDSTCQRRGKDLVKVLRDGTIQKLGTISTESYSGCS